MKKFAILIMIICVLCVFPVFSVSNVPEDVDTRQIQTVQQEHKNTRKFFSDELNRQRTTFLKDIDNRAVFYENEAEDFINTGFWKLGLLWGSIVLISFGILNVLKLKQEEKRLNLKIKLLKEELKIELGLAKKEAFPEKYIVSTGQDRRDFSDGVKDFMFKRERVVDPSKDIHVDKRVTF